jgi:cytochrome b pre-mRNA-processing protein 3
MAAFAMAAGLPRVYGGDKAVTAMVLFSRKQRGEREAAERIYAACRDAARRPALFLAYGVPDTFQGRFEMMALSLFPVLNRLMHEPGDDPELARLVSESFVEDMDGVFREIGVGDPTVPKRMKTLYGSFAGRVTAYRNALADDAALADAIARNVFPGAPADDRAATLAGYLKAATLAVSAADLNVLRQGKIPFPELDEQPKAGAVG